jgi:hypothetical protein
MDRHRLWRNVSRQFDELEQTAPDGFEPLVEVFLVGRTEPVVPAFVETSRTPEHPWVVFQARSAARDQSPEPDEFWVHVHENLIERVEIRFVRKGGAPLGFAVCETDERSDATSDDFAALVS